MSFIVSMVPTFFAPRSAASEYVSLSLIHFIPPCALRFFPFGDILQSTAVYNYFAPNEIFRAVKLLEL